MARFVVTITPPTPNGDIHIGHLAGPFLGADVFTRAQRQRGHDCVFVSYSDDYQSYMLRRGMELNADPRELAAHNTRLIKKSMQAVDVTVDHWLSAQDNVFFRDAVSETFESAKHAGALTWKTTSEPYCPDCKVWGYEAFGRGRCNFCGHDSDASQCEECAQAPDASKMKEFRCKLCGKQHEWRAVGRWFLKLGEFKRFLSELHTAHPMRAPLDSWAEGAIETLEDWGVTRPEDGGLDLEQGGACRVHTWFMGLSGYIATLREYAHTSGQPDLADRFFQDPDANFYHFLGYDCAFSHAVVYPSLLSTMRSFAIGQRFVPNLFLKLDGLNLSTSRGHAIWVADFAEMAPSDAIRLYLATVAPEQEGGNFQRQEFDRWRGEIFCELVPAILNAGQALRAAGQVEMPEEADREILALAERLEWATTPDAFSMRAMAGVVQDALRLAGQRLNNGRGLMAAGLFLAGAGQPLVPRLSDQLAQTFGFDAPSVRTAIRPQVFA